jgi:hypothetical protein
MNSKIALVRWSNGQGSRYVTSSGVLNFAAGETAKTVSVIIVDDGLVQGAQTFSIILANGFGMGVNGPGRVVVTINDNDAPPVTTNPIDDARFFVRAQYFDFLNRVPDQSGEDFWTNQITGVCAPTDAMCINRRRVEVSAAFYIELEFQKTGAYVYRLYRAAFGNNQPFPNPEPHPDAPALLNYAVFTPDRARINADAALLTQSLRDLAANFVNRPAFRTRYPATQTGEQFVDALLATMQTASGVSLVSQRAALLNEFNVGGRARVIYRLAEDSAQNPVDNRAFINAEFNRAFVLMQYFGYLRRDPDLAGFNFWLGLLNQQPSNARGMVCAFTTSQEYQQRFSLVFTRTNQLCGSLFP